MAESSTRVRIKRLREIQMTLPERASARSAGMDLRAAVPSPVRIWPDGCELIPTGIAIDMSWHPGMCAIIFARSGLAANQRVNLANGVGLIDNDYQGEILVALQNNGVGSIDIMPGMRIAQLVFFSPVGNIQWVEVAGFLPTERGKEGFGSTGTC